MQVKSVRAKDCFIEKLINTVIYEESTNQIKTLHECLEMSIFLSSFGLNRQKQIQSNTNFLVPLFSRRPSKLPII